MHTNTEGEKVQGTPKVFLGTISDTTRKQINFSSMKNLIFIIKEYNKIIKEVIKLHNPPETAVRYTIFFLI